MKKLYVVTRGEYSDYCISAIFDSKELAQAYIEKFSIFENRHYFNGFNEIEEFVLNPQEEHLLTNRKPFMVEMRRNGDVGSVLEEVEFNYPNYDGLVEFIGYAHDPDRTMRIVVFANDEKHAIKIANEKRGQIIAMNKWGVNEE